MKGERRHELQHNDLAEWIVTSYERILPYRSSILGGGFLLLAILIGTWIWRGHAASQSAAAWAALGVPGFQLDFINGQQTLGLLEHTTQTYPGTTPAEWAEVFKGDAFLMDGVNRVLADKKGGITNLTMARDSYTKALDSTLPPAAREQALFGKARALESLLMDKSQLGEVVAAYEEVNKNFPNGMYKAIAEQRIEQLQKSDAVTFYRQFAAYTPPKPKVAGPQSELEKLKLPENPPDATSAGSMPGIPAPSLSPAEPGKGELPKTEPGQPLLGPGFHFTPDDGQKAPIKLPSIMPDAPGTETPKSDATKGEAPKTSAAASAAKPDAAKKDK
jgi:hypothetical protein